nr:probable receptor-like protein kinase At4g39110 [Tanacetum cinerariifolium]GEV96620.1 probable receptor-like protein kinase At4g39110 [Tanacetum cinerariifolium]
MRIKSGMKPKEPTYQVVLDALSLTTCYHAFLITDDVSVIYMHQLWATIIKHKSSYQFKIDKKIFSVNIKVLREILNICLKVPGKEFDEPPTEEEAFSFIRELGHSREISDIIPEAMTNQALLDSDAYKTYYAIASGAEPPMLKKSQKKSDSAISSQESPSKKKSAKVNKVATVKPKPTKKKAPVKADRGKGLNVLSEVALSKADQLNEATKRSKKDFHISHASGSGDGTDFKLGAPNDQHLKTTDADEGTDTIPGVLDVPKYKFKSKKESWGNSGEEDEDDENDFENRLHIQVLSLGALLLVEKAHVQNLAYRIMMRDNTALLWQYEIFGCGDRSTQSQYMQYKGIETDATYSFHVTKPEWHWVRLHFYPVESNEFKLNEIKFTAIASEKVVLLHEYSPKGLEIREYWVLWL